MDDWLTLDTLTKGLCMFCIAIAAVALWKAAMRDDDGYR